MMHAFLHRKLLTGAALAGLFATPLFAGAAPAPARTGTHAYLGMAAEAAAKEATANGVTVHSISPDGPAAKAGLKGSDRIVMADGTEVKTFDDLKKALANHKPGDKITLKVMRDNKEQTLTVTLGEAPAARAAAAASDSKSAAFLGVHSQALTAELKGPLGVNTDRGVIVTNVLPGSPAAKAGLEDEDVITKVGDTAVATPEELRTAVRRAGVGAEVTLKVVRGTKTMDLKAKLGEAPAGVAGLPRWAPEIPGMSALPGMPEGFEKFSEHLRPFMSGTDKLPALEKRLQELENRVRQLEQKSAH